MARGGARPNAGRKAGTPNKATQERQRTIAEGGATPLDVMIKNMRFADEQSEEIIAKIMQLEEGANVDSLKELLRFRQMAQDCAKDAAPYVHPRLAAVEHTGKDGRDLIPETDSRSVARAVLDLLGHAKLEEAKD